MRAYSDAFDAGHVHSIEVWDERKRLIGGLYGVAAGASFSIEFALFTRARRLSCRTAGSCLALRRWGYTVLDAKLTNTWKEMGFKEIGRTDYIAMANASEPPPLSRRWHAHDQLQDILDAVAGSRSRVG